jgi:hypothetical protein
MNTNQKPNLVTVIAVTTLVSGIVNLFWGLVASMTAIATIIGIVCLPLAILPAILGVFEIIYATKMLSNPPQPLQPSNSIAVFEILCFLTGNIFSMVVGILSLVFYNDVTVKNYFAELNGTQAPPASTTLSASPKPAPALPVEKSAPEPTLLDAPAEPEAPAKPKRGRKVA